MRLKYWLDSLWTACVGRQTRTIRHRRQLMRRVLEELEERTLLTPIFSIEVLQDTAVEGAPRGYLDYAIFQINNSGDPAPPLAINIQVSGTATPNSDYSIMPAGSVDSNGLGMINFSGGQSSTSYYLIGMSDYLVEGVETVHLQLLSGADYGLGSATAIDLRIVDNTTLVSVTASDPAAAEDGGNGQPDPGSFTFTRSGGDLTQSLTVGYGVSGNATGGMDYQALDYSVTFPANVTSVTVSLNPINDLMGEPDETVIVTLSSGTGYAVDSPSSATVTIEDSGFVDAYVPNVSVTKLGDDAEEDNSLGGVKDQTIRISRSGSGEALTVYYTLAGSADNGMDYASLPTGSIVIPSGESHVDLVVHPIWDTLVEGTESVTVTLTTDPYDATRYDVSATENTTTVNILDSAYPTVAIQATDPVAIEMTPSGNPDNAQFTVVVNRPALHSSHPVQVPYAVTGTATSVTDYIPLSGWITIAGDATSATIDIQPWWDKVQPEEESESVIVELTASVGYSLGASTTATAWIQNTEISIVSLSVTTPDAAEEGPNSGDPVPGVFSLHRVGNLSVPVTVSLGFTGAAQADVDFTGVEFTVTIPADQADVTLVLTPIWDTLIEGDESVTVSLSEGFNYLVDEVQNSGEITIEDAPQPVVSVSATDADAGEDAGNGGANPGSWTISRTGGMTQPLSISYHISGTATPGTDYTTIPSLSASGSITIPAQASSVTIQLNPEWNLELEENEIATLTIDDTASYVLDEYHSTADIIIDDAELPIVNVTTSDADASEEEGPNWTPDSGSYTISRTGNLSKALSVGFSLNGSASTSDYVLNPSGTSLVTIPVGQSSVTITLTPTIDQNYNEGDETRTLVLQTDSTYQLGSAAEATVTIHDAARPVITVVANDSEAREEGASGNAEPGNFLLLRTGSTNATLAVTYQISGTAGAGVDYTSLPTSVTFAAGSATAEITVLPTWDELIEVDETVILTVSESASQLYDVGTPDAAVVTIIDRPLPLVSITAVTANASEEDASGSPVSGLLRISRTGGTSHTLTVSYAFAGTATRFSDYTTGSSANTVTIPVGSSHVDIPVTPIQDTDNEEGDETAVASLSENSKYVIASPASATVTIADSLLPRVSISTSDSQAAEPVNGTDDPGTFTVTRQGRLNQSLTVQLALSGTALVQTDYTSSPSVSSGAITLTFAANQTSTTITITPVTDDNYQEGAEYATVTINSDSNYTILGSPQAMITIADAPELPLIEILATTPETTEPISMMPGYPPSPSDPGVATVTRSGRLDQTVTVQINVSGSASSSTDYTASPGISNSTITVTFQPYETSKMIGITALDDTLKDPDETVVLTIAASQNSSYQSGELDEATIVIHDNHPIITVVASDDIAGEPYDMMPDNGTFTLQRTGGSIGTELTVSFSFGGTASNNTDYSAYSNYSYYSNEVTFPAGYSTAEVIIQPWGDNLEEGIETVVLTLYGNASTYIVGTPSSDTVYIGDNALVDFLLVASDPDATKTNQFPIDDPGEFEIIRLGGNPNVQYTVGYTASGTAEWAYDYTLDPSTSVTFAPYVTHKYVNVIPFTDDPTADGDETVTVTLNSPYHLTSSGTPNEATVTLYAKPNTPPTLMDAFGGPPVEILEDSSSLTIPFRADDEDTPAFDLDVSASTSWAGIFSVSVSQPPGGAASDRELHVTPYPNQFGSATVTVTATDAAGASTSKTIVIKVLSVNDAPSFTTGADVSADEDADLRTIANWATNIQTGPTNESNQTLTFEITGSVVGGSTGSLSDLFSELPTISSAGTLTFKPASNVSGTAQLQVQLKDNGGTASGGHDTSSPVNFQIVINPINDNPTIGEVGSSYSMLEDDASVRTVNFHVDDIETTAFDLIATATVLPEGIISVNVITPPAGAAGDRQLRMSAIADGFGPVTVTLLVTDGNGGSATKTLQVDVTPVNDAPSFTKGTDVIVDEDVLRQTVENWATNISTGPANENAQSVSFLLDGYSEEGEVDGPLGNLFSEIPAISATGTLTFRPAANAYGTAKLNVRARDNGGTDNGGVDTSLTQYFEITIRPGSASLDLMTVDYQDNNIVYPDPGGNIAGYPEVEYDVNWFAGTELVPVWYEIGDTLHATVTFSGTSDIARQVLLKTSWPSGYVVTEALTIPAGTSTIEKQLSLELNGTSIAYVPDYQIRFSVSSNDGATWEDAGTAHNTMYITKDFSTAQSADAVANRTVLHIATVSASGASDIQSAFDGIWEYFKTLKVKTWDGRALTYQHTDKVHEDLDALLRDKWGTCNAWADLFIAVNNIHGISDEFGFSEEHIYSQYWNSLTDRTDIMIKNAIFGAPQAFPDGFEYEWGENVNTVTPGLPGQNNDDPLKVFVMHAVVVMPDGTIYDPSYGAKFDNLLDWEEKALAGIVYYKIDSNGESHSYVRKRVTGEELTYYAWF